MKHSIIFQVTVAGVPYFVIKSKDHYSVYKGLKYDPVQRFETKQEAIGFCKILSGSYNVLMAFSQNQS